MKILPLTGAAVVALGGLALVPHVSTAAPADTRDGARIIEGAEITDNKDNPGSVMLTTSGRPLVCSSSRLGPKWILTARHCIDSKTGGVKAETLIAYTDSVALAKGPTAKVIKGHYPPVGGDFAILELDTDTSPGKVMGYSDKKAQIGDEVRVFGWGMTSKGSKPAPNLKYATVKITSYSKNPFFSGGDDYSTRGVTGSAFSGDSGGALVDKDGLAIGVVSGGDNNPVKEATGMFAQAYQHLEWIKKTTGVAPGVKPYRINADGSRSAL